MGRESPEDPRLSGRGHQEGEDKDAGEQRGVGPSRFARWTQIRAAPCCDRRAAHLPMIQDEPRGRRPRVGGLPTIRHAHVLFSLRGTKTQHYTERTRENGNREAIRWYTTRYTASHARAHCTVQPKGEPAQMQR